MKEFTDGMIKFIFFFIILSHLLYHVNSFNLWKTIFGEGNSEQNKSKEKKFLKSREKDGLSTNSKNYLDNEGIYHRDQTDETDDAANQPSFVFVPENRKIPKTYTTQIERIHPKKIERNITQKIVEISEYNETSKSFINKYIIGNVSYEILKSNLSNFIINDKEIIVHKRKHVDHLDLTNTNEHQSKTNSQSLISTDLNGSVKSKPTPNPNHKALHTNHVHNKDHTQDHNKDANSVVSSKKYSTTDPVPHSSHDNYEKHIRETLKLADAKLSKIVFIGDSCLSQITRDASIRDELIKYHPLNLASPGFRTEHMLYRLTTSNIHKVFVAPIFVVMIGTFNIGIHDTPDSIVAGIFSIINTIQKFTDTGSRIILCSILPRHSISLNNQIDATNRMLAQRVRVMDRVHFLYLDNLFKGKNYPKKLINDDYFMPDHLHPSEKGYHALVSCFKAFLIQFDRAIEKNNQLYSSSSQQINITKTIVDTLI